MYWKPESQEFPKDGDFAPGIGSDCLIGDHCAFNYLHHPDGYADHESLIDYKIEWQGGSKSPQDINHILRNT